MDTDKKNEADTNFTNFHEFLEGENAKRDCNETTDKHGFYRSEQRLRRCDRIMGRPSGKKRSRNQNPEILDTNSVPERPTRILHEFTEGT
jgi:hypothetical protein